MAWAVRRFGSGLSVASSFQDCVLIDIAVREDPAVEVLFVDTGSHFPETLRFVDEVRDHYGLNLRVARPGPEAERVPCGTERCCAVRKVQPLDRALLGRSAWMTGLRRCDAPTRAGAPVVSFDDGRRLVKVNPLAAWSDAQVDEYVSDHGLPVHPLAAHGYLSIGCAPVTVPVVPGEHRRSGRWKGSGQLECGLHG